MNTRCRFSFDNFDSFDREPNITRAFVDGDKFHVDCGASYCANDNPHPTMRWTWQRNGEQFAFVCKVKDNAKTWHFIGPDKLKGEVLECKFANRQEPVYAFCDEYGSQYKSRLLLTASLTFRVTAKQEAAFVVIEETAFAAIEAAFAKQKAAVIAAEAAAIVNAEPVAEDRDECCICLDVEPSIFNEACNHKVMCVACAADYAGGAGVECPICRTPISRLYLDTAVAANKPAVESSKANKRGL